MNLSKLSALSLVALFASSTQAQNYKPMEKSISVLTQQGLMSLTLKECYTPREVSAVLEGRGQRVVPNVKGNFLHGQEAAIYADPVTGSYSIVGVIEDEDRLIEIGMEELEELKRTGRIEDYKYSCIISAKDSGYPSEMDQDPVYKETFRPR